MSLVCRLIARLAEREAAAPHRIHHFLKVYALAQTIGAAEALTPDAQLILELAALTHDVGIKPALEKYGSSAGIYQQREGGVAREILAEFGVAEPVLARVDYLVAHHHTYANIDGADYQILVEADFLVNIFEEKMPTAAIKSVYEKIFRTASGKQLCRAMYPAAFADDYGKRG
ncbi:HD family phosphohydrolase [Planctomycetales bacterium]|nr:HD family phosphohydrolase [Planctomycetales bacterium]